MVSFSQPLSCCQILSKSDPPAIIPLRCQPSLLAGPARWEGDSANSHRVSAKSTGHRGAWKPDCQEGRQRREHTGRRGAWPKFYLPACTCLNSNFAWTKTVYSSAQLETDLKEVLKCMYVCSSGCSTQVPTHVSHCNFQLTMGLRAWSSIRLDLKDAQ